MGNEIVKLTYSVLSLPILMLAFFMTKHHRNTRDHYIKIITLIHNHKSTQIQKKHLLRHYLIFIEDKRFMFHRGFDFYAICRAIYSIIFLKKLQGASTIEQQLVRTITKAYERKITRKFIEIILASKISNQFNKLALADIYLDIAYFGFNTHGVDSLLKKLNIPKSEISHKNSLKIIALLKCPLPRKITLDWQDRYNKRFMALKNITRKKCNILPTTIICNSTPGKLESEF